MGQECCKPLPPQTGVSRRPKHASFHSNLVQDKRRDYRDVYEVVSLIGEGSISNIYKIKKKESSRGGSSRKHSRARKRRTGDTNTCTEELYALKQISLSYVKEGYVDELLNEIKLLRELDHPNIIKAFETYYYKKKLSIVLELCSGGDLYSRHPYSEREAAEIIRQVLSAVKYMHKRNVIHRDIKFENIMFENDEPDAQVKVIDFGLATVYRNRLMTERVGTIYTMSPQVLEGTYSSQADLWSIGVVTFMLLSGKKPFWGRSRYEIMREILTANYNFNGKVWQDKSEAGKQFIAGLLQVDPDQRLDAKQALKHHWLSRKRSLSRRKLDEAAFESTAKDLVRYAEGGEFKRVVMNVIAKRSTPEEILELRRVFSEIDTDHDGTITIAELTQALSQSNLTEEEIQGIFRKLDVNHNNVIMYTEFIAGLLEIRGTIEDHKLADAFDQIDVDDSGYITREDLQKILGSVGSSKDYVDQLIEEADLDRDGRISYEEFKHYLAEKHAETSWRNLAVSGSK